MNYKIVEKDNHYVVFETATEHEIATFNEKQKAKAFMRKLNMGSGFDGWTPHFVITKISNNINKVRTKTCNATA